MRANPRADWRISDVEGLCREYGVTFATPRGGGSHCKVTHASQTEIMTIPFKRPIKPVYIRKLIEFIDAVRTET
jgi:hypothetical protein